jgi:hypothetical protein
VAYRPDPGIIRITRPVQSHGEFIAIFISLNSVHHDFGRNPSPRLASLLVKYLFDRPTTHFLTVPVQHYLDDGYTRLPSHIAKPHLSYLLDLILHEPYMCFVSQNKIFFGSRMGLLTTTRVGFRSPQLIQQHRAYQAPCVRFEVQNLQIRGDPVELYGVSFGEENTP